MTERINSRLYTYLIVIIKEFTKYIPSLEKQGKIQCVIMYLKLALFFYPIQCEFKKRICSKAPDFPGLITLVNELNLFFLQNTG